MAKHEVVIHENTGALKTVAPYLGVYVSKETVKIEGFIAAVASKCGLPAIEVEAILTGSFEAIEELEKISLVRVHTDIGMICGTISGSFPTSDAEFNPDKNKLELALRLDEGLRYALADVTPTIVAEDDITKVRVDNIADLISPRPYNVIHGLGVFRVSGLHLVTTDEGSSVFLQNEHGATFEVVIDRVYSEQLFTGRTKALLEPGDYKLVVRSRGGDAEGPLQTSTRKVKYLKLEPVVAGVEITEWTVVEGGSDINAIFGANIPNSGFSGDGRDWDNTLKGFYTNPETGDEVRVNIGPIMDPTQSKRLRFQPGYFYRGMSGVAKGVWCPARVELWCGDTKYGEAEFMVRKG